MDTSNLPFGVKKTTKHKHKSKKIGCDLDLSVYPSGPFADFVLCEKCGVVIDTNLHDPHHIISRGAGGPDSIYNCAYICGLCHQKVHNGNISRDTLLAIHAKLFRITVEELLDKIQEDMVVFRKGT